MNKKKNINQKKLKIKEVAENKRSENDYINIKIKHNEYVVCTKEYH